MASTTLDHHRQVIRNRTLTAEWRRRIGAHLCRRQQLAETSVSRLLNAV
jgi:hypothetical protein